MAPDLFRRVTRLSGPCPLMPPWGTGEGELLSAGTESLPGFFPFSASLLALWWRGGPTSGLGQEPCVLSPSMLSYRGFPTRAGVLVVFDSGFGISPNPLTAALWEMAEGPPLPSCSADANPSCAELSFRDHVSGTPETASYLLRR